MSGQQLSSLSHNDLNYLQILTILYLEKGLLRMET